MKKKFIAGGLFAAGLVLLIAPILAGGAYPPAAATSGTVLGALMVVVAVGLAYASLEVWSCIALGLGAWAIVAPLLFGFYGGNAGFWMHMFGGFMSLLCGVAGHDLLERTEPADGRGSDSVALDAGDTPSTVPSQQGGKMS